MDDERAQWSLPDETPSDSWRPEGGRLTQREAQWSALPAESSDWAFDDSLQTGSELYRRQDVFQMPDQHGQFLGDPYQLQVPADGLYDWNPGSSPNPACPQHGYQPYPGFAGYPGYQDSQGYQTALPNPLYEQQQDSGLFPDSQSAFATNDDDLNACPLGSEMCRNLERGYPTGPPIEDDDDDHPPGSQSNE